VRSLIEETARLNGEAWTPAYVPMDWSGSPDPPVITVADHVIPFPTPYREYALAQDFHDVTVGPVTFHGIAEVTSPALADIIRAIDDRLTPTFTFFRRSPAGQVEPHFIHTDIDMGHWTAVLYLTDPPETGDGTSFWKYRPTGAFQSAAKSAEEHTAEAFAWTVESQWDCWNTIDAKFNRLLLFPSAAFHSRTIRENYGTGHRARLTQVMFGTFQEGL
jgi:hypothetical protein